jgi:DNA-directed RNA polymerase specialized sigma24 family protein
MQKGLRVVEVYPFVIRLTARESDVLYLREQHRLSFGRIGAQLGVTGGAVRVFYLRAHRKIRRFRQSQREIQSLPQRAAAA